MAPKVSVCVITYNHGSFIRQCLDNILSQETDFEFDVVIGEDKSTDNTGAIVLEYQQKYPEKISIVSPPENMGGWYNWKRTLAACKGQYIAIVDGDDYWISSRKLQKQVNMLDEHPEYAMSIHAVEIQEDEGNKGRALDTYEEGITFSTKDVILRGWFIATCSMMFRKSSLPVLPEWTKNLMCLDLASQLSISTSGDIGYINEKLGLYRIHSGGISQVHWTGKANAMWYAHIEVFSRFNNSTNGKYWPHIKVRLGRVYQQLMKGNPFMSKIYLDSMAKIIGLGPIVYVPMVKHWVVTNLIPARLYKAYSSGKQSVAAKTTR